MAEKKARELKDDLLSATLWFIFVKDKDDEFTEDLRQLAEKRGVTFEELKQQIHELFKPCP